MTRVDPSSLCVPITTVNANSEDCNPSIFNRPLQRRSCCCWKRRTVISHKDPQAGFLPPPRYFLKGGEEAGGAGRAGRSLRASGGCLCSVMNVTSVYRASVVHDSDKKVKWEGGRGEGATQWGSLSDTAPSAPQPCLGSTPSEVMTGAGGRPVGSRGATLGLGLARARSELPAPHPGTDVAP